MTMSEEKKAHAYQGLEERTVVLMKPDAVKRGLVGEAIARFEKAGLRLVALKMITLTPEFARGHYPGTDEWLAGMGNKTLENYEKYGIDADAELGTSDPLEIGHKIFDWIEDYMTSGPVVAMALQGNHAIDNVRMIVGNTMPVFAEPGTFRGDFSVDSPALANAQKRAIRNLIHASGDPEEAAHEIEYWFGPEDIQNYNRADEAVMFHGE